MNALDNANIEKPCSGLASFAFPEAKSSKTGVSVEYVPSPDRQWYVLRIKYGKVQAVADSLVEQGTYVYLAMVWKDVRNKVTGKKHRKLFPFMNILFAYVTPSEAEKYVVDLNSCNFVSDDLVRVTFGPFEGLTGRVARIARQKRVVIYINGLKSGLTTAYIPPYCLEKV